MFSQSRDARPACDHRCDLFRWLLKSNPYSRPSAANRVPLLFRSRVISVIHYSKTAPRSVILRSNNGGKASQAAGGQTMDFCVHFFFDAAR